MAEPIVFISYSHDSLEHKAWVLKLATDLRTAGIDAVLDQWDLVPGQDTVAFMSAKITESNRVLLICTEKYVTKAEGGVGGVGYERLIVTAELVDRMDTKKFVPVVRNNTSSRKVPIFLGSRLYIDLSDDAYYDAGWRWCTDPVAGEWGHVVGGVGQFQHRFAHNLTGRLRAKLRSSSISGQCMPSPLCFKPPSWLSRPS